MLSKQGTEVLALLLGSALLAGCVEGVGSDVTEDEVWVPPESTTPVIPHMSCAYPPPETFGHLIGETIPGNISWTGYGPGAVDSSDVTEVSITEFYDCDGSKGIDAVMFETVGFG